MQRVKLQRFSLHLHSTVILLREIQLQHVKKCFLSITPDPDDFLRK